MTPARLKSTVLLAGLAVSGLTLVSWTQPWFRIDLATESATGAVTVGGEVAAGGLSALALAGLALVGALSIAGPVFRVVLAGLEVLIGVAVLVSAIAAIVDPVRVSSPSITEATGVAGTDSVARLVGSVTSTAWPWLAVVLGALTVAVGVTIGATARRWPGSSRRYSAARLVTDDGVAATGSGSTRTDRPDASGTPPVSAPVAAREADTVADWDALSDGSDPTSR